MIIRLKKKPEIIETVESNYRIIRRVYHSFYSDTTDIFFEHIHSLNPDEIQQLDEDLKSNGWAAINLLEIQNSIELLSIMHLFYYLNGRLPLTNRLLIVSNGEVPDGEEKINLKNLYEMFKENINDEVFGLQQMFNEVNDAATEQKNKMKLLIYLTIFLMKTILLTI